MLGTVTLVRIVRMLMQDPRAQVQMACGSPTGSGRRMVALTIEVAHVAMLMLMEVLMRGEEDQSSG